MTDREMLEMARLMGCSGPGACSAHAELRIIRLVAEAVRLEREACAQILDRNADLCASSRDLHDVLRANAAAIRARSAGSDV